MKCVVIGDILIVVIPEKEEGLHLVRRAAGGHLIVGEQIREDDTLGDLIHGHTQEIRSHVHTRGTRGGHAPNPQAEKGQDHIPRKESIGVGGGHTRTLWIGGVPDLGVGRGRGRFPKRVGRDVQVLRKKLPVKGDRSCDLCT